MTLKIALLWIHTSLLDNAPSNYLFGCVIQKDIFLVGVIQVNPLCQSACSYGIWYAEQWPNKGKIVILIMSGARKLHTFRTITEWSKVIYTAFYKKYLYTYEYTYL